MPSVSDEQILPQNEVTDTQKNETLNSGDKSLQHVWSIGDIRENAMVWSLAADDGLLKYLQQFSSELTKKAHESTLGVNKLLHDTNMTDAKLRNVTDRFLTLSDSQFIENRVYDEDISEKSDANSGRKVENETKENGSGKGSQIDPMPKLIEALQSGLKVLDEAYDILDANAANSDIDSDQDSDSDNETSANGMPPQNQGIYEPKDPYIARPLPHLIGSRGFHELEHVGVADLPSEDELQDDQGSISESDEELEKPMAHPDASESSSSEYDTDIESSESEEPAVKRKMTQQSTEHSYSSSEDDINLFENDSEESDNEETPNTKGKSITKPKRAPKRSSKKTAATSKEKKEQNLFREEDEEEDLFTASGGLFGASTNLFKKKTKSGGLFDDAEGTEESDTSSKEAETESQKLSSEEEESYIEVVENTPKKTYGGVSLFGGAVAKDFFAKSAKDTDSAGNDTASQASGSSGKKKLDLFGDSDEDDIFASKPPLMSRKKAPSTVSTSSSHRKTQSLFGSGSEPDEAESMIKTSKSTTLPETVIKSQVSDLFDSDSDGDLFGSSLKLQTEEKKHKPPTGAVSMFGGGKQGKSLLEALNKRNAIKSEQSPTEVEASESSSAEDSMFTSKPPPLGKASKKVEPVTRKTGGLFDDDDSDDDFFAPAKSTIVRPTLSKNKPGLLDSDSGDDMFSSISKPTLSKQAVKVDSNAVLPEEENDDDGLFSFEQKESSAPSPNLFEDFEQNEMAQSPSDKMFLEDSEEVEIHPKKLPGAVPMFKGPGGGAELAAAISKRRTDSHVSDKSTDSSGVNSEKVTKIPGKEVGEILIKQPSPSSIPCKIDIEEQKKESLNLGIENVTAKPFRPTTNRVPVVWGESVRSEKSTNFVSKLGAKLAIDPTTLLPGAVPVPTPVFQAEISFDKPATANTLRSLTKTRSRGQANRRPPSRRPKAKSPFLNTTSVKNDAPDPKPTKPKETIGDETPDAPERKIHQITASEMDKKTFQKVAIPEEETFKNIFSSSIDTRKTKSNITADFDDIDSELFSGSLFDKSSKKKSKSTNHPGPKLFESKISDELNTGKDSEESSMKIFDDDDDNDNIFQVLNIKPKEKTRANKEPSNEDIFGDDLDASFSTHTKKKVGTDHEKLSVEATDIVEGKKKGEADSKSGKKLGDIFGDHDNRFEDDKAITTVKHSKPKETKQGLFGDDDDVDDIFGDVKVKETSPSVKTKTTKKKETKTKSIFDDDDDIDDIFKSGKPKKSSAKKKKTKAVEPSKDIFNDPLSMP